ncbi:hypothetical protein ABZ468_49880 [Streptomyces sp. NPDC005708]|uniref:hypothetical protein n=1 Tax=Streptomyces sp. NPDC005708 TaxID=3154564 RepID=UPI0033EBFFB1
MDSESTAIRASLKRHRAAQAPASATVEDQEQLGEIGGERAVLAHELASLKGDLAALYAKAPESP